VQVFKIKRQYEQIANKIHIQFLTQLECHLYNLISIKYQVLINNEDGLIKVILFV